MTPAGLLETLRARGYVVELAGDRVRVSHAERAPTDEAKAIGALHARRDALAALLGAESNPAVKLVQEVFQGARLIAVRQPGTEPADPALALVCDFALPPAPETADDIVVSPHCRLVLPPDREASK